MKHLKIQAVLLIFGALTLTSSNAQQEQSVSVSVTALALKTGNWSTRGAVLSVNSTGASLALSCGSGILSSPLTLDSNNMFRVYGTYSSGVMGGVVGPDGSFMSNQNQFAIYTGTYNSTSEVLTLQISIPNTGATLQTLEFTFGDPSSPLFTCL
jgi:hypothetical protein